MPFPKDKTKKSSSVVCKCLVSPAVFSHWRRPVGSQWPNNESAEFKLFAVSGAASSALQNWGRELSAELLLNLLCGRQISGPSGKEDLDNKALQIASHTLIVFECEQEVNVVLCCRMKFRLSLSKRGLHSVPWKTSE